MFGKYPGLFGESDTDDDQEPDDLRESEDDRFDRLAKEAEEKDERRRKGWYTMAYLLATGDVTRMEAVLSTNANVCFTHLAFEHTNKKIAEYARR